MLNKNSCEIAVNLALMLHEQNKHLTPVNGTLMHELSKCAYTPMSLAMCDGSKDYDFTNLHRYIYDSTQGGDVYADGKTTYAPSKHDALMDNYIDTISKLVTNHVQYARSVVYPKVQRLQEEVQTVLNLHQVQQPEDFFEVTMYRLPEVMDSELVASEVLAYDNTVALKEPHVINFGAEGLGEFDLKAYVTTGDEGNDALVHGWMDSVGINSLRGDVFSHLTVLPAAMSLSRTIEHSFINFIFYRSLAIRQDMGLGMSSAQLVSRAADNRDYFAQTLKSAITTYRQFIKQGIIIDPSSETNFSYLSNKRFQVTLYQDSFQVAQEAGASIEQVFGYIAEHGNTPLTVEMLKTSGSIYTSRWNAVRGLYMAHITSTRDLAMKMALKLKTIEVIYQDETPEETEFYNSNKNFREDTAKLINQYVEKLDNSCLDNVSKVCIDLIAGIAYRHTASARIINEMVNLMDKDTTMEPGQAALISTVKYVSDFLIEELTVN